MKPFLRWSRFELSGMAIRSGVLGAGLLGAGGPGYSQEAAGIKSLEDLLNTQVIIAAKRPQAEDAAPSIVSVVTRGDIERYGWRDLTDVLRSLPGFDFALDGTGLIGLSERGIWAHEGKALVMVNGISISPLHNGNVNYFGFIPAEMIERVEVIRGPGSAVYGQFAGVTVINVMTRGSKDADGGRFSVRGSTIGAGNNGGGGFLSISDHLPDHVSFSMSAGYVSTPFSNRPFEASFAQGQPSFPQDKGNARRENTYVVGEVQALGTEIQFLRTSFQIAQVDGGGQGPMDPEVPGIPIGVPGSGIRVVQGVRLFRSVPLHERFSLEVTLNRLENTMGVVYPQSLVGGGIFTSGDARSQSTGDLALKWTPTFPATLMMGGGYIQDWERSVNLSNQGALRDPGNPSRQVPQITLNTSYGYLQYDQQLGALGITAGARYEDNAIGHAFAPRLGLTYVKDRLSAKLLFGESFREPTLFQKYSTLFAFNPSTKTELIRSTEMELAWHFNSHIVWRTNVYQMAVTQAIEGSFNQQGQYFIQNSGSVRSRGVELGLNIKYWLWGGFANLSYTKPEGRVEPFYLSSDGHHFLGVSPIKLNTGTYFRLGPFLFAPSLIYASSRATQTAASANSGLAAGSLLPALVQSESVRASLIGNLAITWKDCLGKNTESRLSIFNLANADYPLLQPYYGGHPPLPTNDRSFTLSLVWRF